MRAGSYISRTPRGCTTSPACWGGKTAGSRRPICRSEPRGATEEAAERARAAVTMRIRAALLRIEKEHPALGRHLARSIRTGTVCRYDPEVLTRWML